MSSAGNRRRRVPAASGRLMRTAFALLALAFPPAARDAAGQVIETPVPFDTHGRVLVMTPALQARLGLTSEVLRVPRDYREARLYAVTGGEFVIAAHLPAGGISRVGVSAAEQAALRTAVDAALSDARNPVAQENEAVVSAPAREAFVVHQTALGLLVYGPAAAVLVNDDVGSAAAYLAVAGGSFFWSYGLSQSGTITRAQDHLAWHFARRGAATAIAATYVASESKSHQAYAGAALVGGIAGAVTGVKFGRPYTDAEAHAMTLGSTLASVSSLGVMSAVGRLDDSDGQRVETAIATGAAFAGLPVGLRFARRAAYTITAGDVGTMATAGVIGAGTVLTAVAAPNANANVIIAGAAAGVLAGAFVGDRVLVRPFDHTVSQSNLLRVGAGAGALLGVAASLAFDLNDARPALGLATSGATLGMMATHSLMRPRTAPGRGTPPAPAVPTRDEARRGPEWSFNLEAAALAAAGTPGRHSLVRITF